jgi:hypothetical protein
MRTTAEINKYLKQARADLEAEQVGKQLADYDFVRQNALRKAISALESELEAATKAELQTKFGVPTAVTQRPSASQTLPPPSRITEALAPGQQRKSISSTIEGLNYKEPSEAYQKRIAEILDALWIADSIESVEDFLWDAVQIARDHGVDKPRAFTSGLYSGIATKLAALSTRLHAVQIVTREQIEAIQQQRESADLNAIVQRVAQLEQHIADNPPVVYRGVWAEGEFEKNNVTTHGGSAWIAKRRTTSKPQSLTDGAECDWQLMVKRGSNGKDARQ